MSFKKENIDFLDENGCQGEFKQSDKSCSYAQEQIQISTQNTVQKAGWKSIQIAEKAVDQEAGNISVQINCKGGTYQAAGVSSIQSNECDHVFQCSGGRSFQHAGAESTQIGGSWQIASQDSFLYSKYGDIQKAGHDSIFCIDQPPLKEVTNSFHDDIGACGSVQIGKHSAYMYAPVGTTQIIYGDFTTCTKKRTVTRKQHNQWTHASWQKYKSGFKAVTDPKLLEELEEKRRYAERQFDLNCQRNERYCKMTSDTIPWIIGMDYRGDTDF